MAANKAQYEALFTMPGAARAFELRALQRPTLPPYAIAVREGKEPDPHYWAWLIRLVQEFADG